MAAFDTTRTTYGSAGIAGRFTRVISNTISAVIGWNDARVTRNALSSLTDRELQDIGLSRSDIDAVADNSRLR